MTVVLITGCSSGIGLETALAFARQGATTCATMRNPAKAEALTKRAADEGLDLDVVALDVTDDASVALAVTAVRDRHGAIDVLVNNAGVGYGGPVETIPMDAARSVMETNFWGALRMIRAVVPDMRTRRTGAIINVTSTAALIPGSPYSGMYAASKHGLEALSQSLASELTPFGVRVVCIAPGFFATEISANSNGVDEGLVGTAYEADGEWFERFMTSSVSAGADPRVVADAITAAASDPATPLSRPVGDDADMFVSLWAQSGTYERWMNASIPFAESVAGPRPEPAS